MVNHRITFVYSKRLWYLNHRDRMQVTTCQNHAWYSRFEDKFGRSLLPQLCIKAYKTATTIRQHGSLPKWLGCLLWTSNGCWECLLLITDAYNTSILALERIINRYRASRNLILAVLIMEARMTSEMPKWDHKPIPVSTFPDRRTFIIIHTVTGIAP
jgi:hypothetical protein